MTIKSTNTPFVAALTVLATLTLLQATHAASSFELCSPKNGDHFEVAKPMLFWESSPGSRYYEVFIDQTKAGEVPAADLPVMRFALATALAPGAHEWSVRAICDENHSITSGTFRFTVDSSTNWPSWAIGPFVRYGRNPILTPQGTTWEAWNTYNPGVIFDDGRFRMLYRGQENFDKKTRSRIGYAESRDGVTFTRSPAPVIDATESFESKYGCEDARISKYQGVFYTFYTGAFSNRISLCEATSLDGTNWTKHGVIQVGSKNGALICDPHGVPLKINGKFAMYVGDQRCGVSWSDDLTNWTPIVWINMHFPKGWTTPWEPCVAVANYSADHPDDIVLFIAGTLNGKGKWFYAISEALFSKTNLTRKVDQLNDCIFKPREPYESGTFKNCLWMNSLLLHDHQWWMHYGAGDRNIGLATAPAD